MLPLDYSLYLLQSNFRRVSICHFWILYTKPFYCSNMFQKTICGNDKWPQFNSILKGRNKNLLKIFMQNLLLHFKSRIKLSKSYKQRNRKSKQKCSICSLHSHVFLSGKTCNIGFCCFLCNYLSFPVKSSMCFGH